MSGRLFASRNSKATRGERTRRFKRSSKRIRSGPGAPCRSWSVRSAAALLAAAIAAGAAVASAPNSRPDHVTARCGRAKNAWACRVALRYLAALDLDRTRSACSLLEPDTLAAAGGMAGCRKTLSSAHGIRIRYSILDVHASPLGRSVYFTTRAEGRTDLRQAMIVTPRRLILAVAPAPCSTC
jgi:hypothetical protein